MNKTVILVLALVLSLSVCSSVSALDENKKTCIQIIGSSDDQLGQVLIYNVKELIRSSENFILISNDDQTKEEYFQLYINTMPYEEEPPYNCTIYNIVWTYCSEKLTLGLPFYLDTTCGYVGSVYIKNTAESIIAQTDEKIENILKVTRKAK
ncbi:MAG TPA: hypothetical protein VEC37_07905 [Bacillota bacterium]|nr:hypothetical protein [Bacillota bacterium]